HPPDLILSDPGLHQFDAFSALALARQKAPDVPFILFTGSLNQEAASRALKSGAADCILKNHLNELAPAVLRALSCDRDRTTNLAPPKAALGQADGTYRRLV